MDLQAIKQLISDLKLHPDLPPKCAVLINKAFNASDLSLERLAQISWDLLESWPGMVLPDWFFQPLITVLEALSSSDSWICNDIGAFYYNGKSGACDFTKALEWYEKGSQMGNLQCDENLGYLYLYGQGTARNPQKAYECFSKAALGGYMHAMLQTARMFEFGFGVRQDLHMARRIYDSIENNSNQEEDWLLRLYSLLGLGRIYSHCDFPEADSGWAHSYFEQALAMAEDTDWQSDFLLKKEIEQAIGILKKWN